MLKLVALLPVIGKLLPLLRESSPAHACRAGYRSPLQVILTSSLESKAFGMPGIKYFNAVSQFLMAALVISVFLFSMGNKPKACVSLGSIEIPV